MIRSKFHSSKSPIFLISILSWVTVSFFCYYVVFFDREKKEEEVKENITKNYFSDFIDTKSEPKSEANNYSSVPNTSAPDSFPYPLTNGISKEYQFLPEKFTVEHQNWKQIYVKLPPWFWETPRGLGKQEAEWFWKQRENHWHFNDTTNSVWGCVRVITNGHFNGNFIRKQNNTHYINIEGEPSFTKTPQHKIAFYLTSHETNYFQHFLDNGLPHISLMLIATDLEPKDVTIILKGWTTETVPSVLKRWGFNVEKSSQISAEMLVLPEVVPKVHSMFYDVFRKGMNLEYEETNQIVFVSRKRDDTSKFLRIIMNQDEVFDRLKEVFGQNLILYKPRKNDFNSTLNIFTKAKAVIGIHGGAMYNALFSSPKTTIVEIVPVKDNGLYPGQVRGTAVPPFAHLAIYTGSMLMHQQFYRYYQVGTSTNVNIDIEKFITFLKNIPALQNLAK